MTDKPKVKSGRRSLEETLATIKDYVPNARIVNRKIVLPRAYVASQRKPLRPFYPKLKAAVTTPKATSLEEKTTYSGMNKYYREYRTNSLIRACVNVRALMATNKGFEVEIFHKDPQIDEKQHADLQDQHKDLLRYINEINKQVNADNAWKLALIWMQLVGRAGFEINRDIRDGPPTGLIPLNAYDLEPEYPETIAGMAVANPWRISSFKYEGKKQFFRAEDVLYLPYNSLDAKQYGLSDVEPVLEQAKAKRMIVEEILPEACIVSWSGVCIIQVDSTNMTDTQEDEYMQGIIDEFKPSKVLVVNQKVTNIQVVDTKPNLRGIIETARYIDEDLIGHFSVPPFIVARHREVNRATAYTQLDQWLNGDITNLQRTMRRLTDERWNDYLAMQYLKLTPEAYAELDYRPSTVWNPIKMVDFIETGQTLAALKSADAITTREVYRILGLNEADIEQDLIADAEMQGRIGPSQQEESRNGKKTTGES